MMTSRNFLLLFVLVILTFGLAAQKTMGEHIDEMANKYVKKKKNHALVVGIIKDGKSWIGSYGQMSKKDASVPDENTVFEIGAVTSVFTTTLMQLNADAGFFNSENPVKDYLLDESAVPSFHPLKCVEIPGPEPDYNEQDKDKQRRIYTCFQDPYAKAECMSFCDLAAHISGLPPSPEGWYRWRPLFHNKLDASYKDGDREAFFQRLRTIRPDYVPGTKYLYSDFGIALLGNVLEEIRNKPYETLLQEEIFIPLGMDQTRIASSAFKGSKLAKGHNYKGKPIAPFNLEAMAPAAGLKSSVSDLLKFVKANLNTQNKALDNAFAEVHQNKIHVPFGKMGRYTSMGYGWFTSTLSRETNLPVVWMNGGTPGFRAYVGFIKDSGTAVILLSNSSGPVDEMGFDMLEVLNAPQDGPAAPQLSMGTLKHHD